MLFSPGRQVLVGLYWRRHSIENISNEKRSRIHEYLSFRAAVKTDAGTAAAAHTDECKVLFARHSGIIPKDPADRIAAFKLRTQIELPHWNHTHRVGTSTTSAAVGKVK